MILLHYPLKSVGRMPLRKTLNALNNLMINKRVRLFATETAVQKISIRSLQKHKKMNNTISWFLLVIPASAFGLGTWQVFRKFEKDKLNDELMKKIDQPPIDLPKDLNELKNLEYRKIRVRGKFDHSKELLLGPRPKVDENFEKYKFSLLSTCSAGYLVVTPFKLSDRNLTILVNRGWVPAKEKFSSLRTEGPFNEEVEIIGLVRLHENRKKFGAKNNPKKNIWIYRNLYQMSEITGAAPVFLDLEKSSFESGGPAAGQTIVGFKNDHLVYMYTWYGLSIASGYLWYLRHFPKVPIMV